MRLPGKSALITGAARGIGAAFARAYPVRLDVTDQASIDAAMAEVAGRAGGLDILVNNAAVFDHAPIVEITHESFDRLVGINVAGTLFTLQAAARRMIEQGRGGKTINMASQAGRRGEPLVAVYCATKAAVLTQSAGLALIPDRINVNAIAAGVVEGEHWDHVDALFARYENRRPARRGGWLARRCSTAAWAAPRTRPAWPCSWRLRTPTTSSPRPTTSTAASG